MSDKVFNPNFLTPATENLKRAQKELGVDGDAFNATNVMERQKTFVGSIVPAKPVIDATPPVITGTDPQVLDYLGRAFFDTNRVIIDFGETVLNAHHTYNYQLLSGSHIDTLEILRVNELTADTGNTRVEIIFTGAMSASGLLDIMVNPSGSTNKISDSAGNALVTETLSWYVDILDPWIETLAPSPSVRLMTDTFNWTFNLTFSEFMPSVAGSWEDLTQWQFTLLKKDWNDAPISVTATGVSEVASTPFEYSNEDGSLEIQIETQNPFLGISPSEAPAYEALKLEISKPNGMVDRAGNPLQPEVTYYLWEVEYVGNDQTGPQWAVGEPINKVARVVESASMQGRYSVYFDEAVVGALDPANWSFTEATQMEVTSVTQMSAGDLSLYGTSFTAVDGYHLTIGAKGTTTGTAYQAHLTPTLQDAAGNAITPSSLVCDVDRVFPMLANRGVSQGLVNFGADHGTTIEIYVAFDTPVKSMTEANLKAFWGWGNDLPVQVAGTMGGWTPHTSVARMVSVVEVSGLNSSYPDHIMAHRIGFKLLDENGSELPDGSELFRVYLNPVVPSLSAMASPQPTDPPLMPMGWATEQAHSSLHDPTFYNGSWGNPLTPSNNANVYEDDFATSLFFEARNHRSETIPNLVSVTPADGSTVESDLSTVTFTFDEPVSGYGYLEVRDASGSVVPSTSAVASGNDIVITLPGSFQSGPLFVFLTSVTDAEGDTNDSTFNATYTVRDADYSFDVQWAGPDSVYYGLKSDASVRYYVTTKGADIAMHLCNQITVREDRPAGNGLWTTLYEATADNHQPITGTTGELVFNKDMQYDKLEYRVHFVAYREGTGFGDPPVATQALHFFVDFSSAGAMAPKKDWVEHTDAFGNKYELWDITEVHALLAFGEHAAVPQFSFAKVGPLDSQEQIDRLPIEWGNAGVDAEIELSELQDVYDATSVAHVDNPDFPVLGWYGKYDFLSREGVHFVDWYRKWDADGAQTRFGRVQETFTSATQRFEQRGRYLTFDLPVEEYGAYGVSDLTLTSVANPDGSPIVVPFRDVTDSATGKLLRFGPVYWEDTLDESWRDTVSSEFDGDWSIWGGAVFNLVGLEQYRAEYGFFGQDGVTVDTSVKEGFTLRDQRPISLSWTQTENTLSASFTEPSGAGFSAVHYLVEGLDADQQGTFSKMGDVWSMSISGTPLVDGQSYTLKLVADDSTADGVWASTVSLTAVLDAPTNYALDNIDYDSVSGEMYARTVSAIPGSGQFANSMQPVLAWTSTGVTPQYDTNSRTWNIKFIESGGSTVPTVHWRAYSTEDGTDYGTGVSQAGTDFTGQLVSISVEDFGSTPENRFKFYLEVSGHADGVEVVAPFTIQYADSVPMTGGKPFYLDVAAPFYAEQTLRGVTVEKNGADTAYIEPSTTVLWSDYSRSPFFYTNMWKGMENTHPSYDASNNLLELHYKKDPSVIEYVFVPDFSNQYIYRTKKRTMATIDHAATLGDVLYHRVMVWNGVFQIDGLSPNAPERWRLQRGLKYVFFQDAASAASHPFNISTTSDGTHNGGAPFADAVVEETAEGRYITVDFTGTAYVVPGGTKPPAYESTLPALYYYCSNHPGMGGSLTDPSDDYDPTVLLTADSNTAYQTADTFYAKYALSDPRTAEGWDNWKSYLGWSKYETEYNYDLILKNGKPDDQHQNKAGDKAPYVHLIPLPHTAPILVDVKQFEFGADRDSLALQDFYSGRRTFDTLDPNPTPSATFFDFSQNNTTAEYSNEVWNAGVSLGIDTDEASMVGTNIYAMGKMLAGVAEGLLPELLHFEVSSDLTMNFGLELHYVDPMEPGRIYVKAHSDHLGFIGATSTSSSSPTDFNYQGTEERVYGVPYPLRIVHKKNDYDQHMNQANMVGDTWLFNRWILPPERAISSNSLSFWHYYEAGNHADVETLGGSWVDRGDFNDVGGKLGRVIRIGLSLRPYINGKISVQKIPDTDQYGIPVTIEVGQKPYATLTTGGVASNMSLAGADFITFWLVANVDWTYSNDPEYAFVQEEENNTVTNFGPKGGHNAGTSGWWLRNTNMFHGRQLKHSWYTVDVQTSAHGIYVERPAISDLNDPNSPSDPTGGSNPPSVNNP